MADLLKQIAASGIELWSDADSQEGNNVCEEIKDIENDEEACYTVRQDAGIQSHKKAVSQTDALKIIMSTKKSILATKSAYTTPAKTLNPEQSTSTATPSTQLNSATSMKTATKAKKSVSFDYIGLENKQDKPFMRSESDANWDTFEKGKQAMQEDSEESDSECSDDQGDYWQNPQSNPYKRRKLVDSAGVIGDF